MNITVIGTGYVGLVTGTCFTEMGNKVTCVDIDSEKISNLKEGILPIYEPGLDAMVLENRSRGTLSFTTELKTAVKDSGSMLYSSGNPHGAGQQRGPKVRYGSSRGDRKKYRSLHGYSGQIDCTRGNGGQGKGYNREGA